MDYDINRPWMSLDKWQDEYIFNKEPNQDNFLLTGRQVGKTTAMSIRAIELCVNHFKEGENVLIASLTEKQGQIMLARALAYATEKYPKLICRGKNKPTMHRISFMKGGTRKKPKMNHIYCYAAGETGQGLRGFTIKKLLVDEGSRMGDEFFISTTPMLSVVKGSMDIASTPCGKTGFFYKASLDEGFNQYYVSGEDCPRHTKEFLEKEKARMTKLAYAQEYQALFLDDLKRIFPDDILKQICVLKRNTNMYISPFGKYYLGVDVAGFGKDDCTYEIVEMMDNDLIEQRDHIIERRNYTTDTSNKIIDLNKNYNFKQIGVDDGGVGFGVYSELMNHDETKRKTTALNNASRPVTQEGGRSKKILKEEMYFLLLTLAENKRIKLLEDDEVRASLASMQMSDDGKIYGSDSHIAEGLIRAVWECEKNKGLSIFIRRF